MNGEPTTEGRAHAALSLKAQIECLLFVANEPVSIERLATVLEAGPDQVEETLSTLAQEYLERGIRLQRKGKRVQIVTAPEAADLVRAFLGLELTGRLSPAALETLAIVAYRQPVTRAEIEGVRGVNSDSVLRTLLHRGLVEEQGRLDQAGRPIIYGTTFEFLQQFGLANLEELPPLLDASDPEASTHTGQ
ncbi:MAG: SMC-Scp complex subunit ScpB [Anaerolineae bacterium]|nr:SMC-Scp complex subunit ScpB [Anaerolineae bacterium]